MRTRLMLALSVLAVLPLAAAAPAIMMGPPWISIEYPPSPYDATVRDAYLLVHTFHHGTPTTAPLTGTAEGMVDGQRRSVKLAFAGTSRTGVYALKKQWASNGTWILAITAWQGPEDGVTAMVDIGSGGEVARVRVPTRQDGRYPIPAKVTAADLEEALRARVALNAAVRADVARVP